MHRKYSFVLITCFETVWNIYFLSEDLHSDEQFLLKQHVAFRPDFTSKLVHVLAFGTPKFYIVPYDKIKHELVNLSSNCDVKSGLSLNIFHIMGL